MVHNNTSITDTHRITYLQNSVSGKAKDLIHAYSCDPSYYQTALSELIRHFDDHTIIVNAFIKELEHRQMNYQNKQSYLPFSSFLKRVVQACQYLGFTADLQSTTLVKKAKEKTKEINLFWKGQNIVSLSWAQTRCLWIFNNGYSFKLKSMSKLFEKAIKEPSVFKPQSLSPRTTCKPSNTITNSQCQSTTHHQKIEENIGTFGLSKNHRQLHKTFRIKHLTQNDFVRSVNENKALPHALSISCAHQVFDITFSAGTICVQMLEQQTHKHSCPSQKRCQVCCGCNHTTFLDPAKQIKKRPTAAFSTEVFSCSNPTASSSSKASSKTPYTSSQLESQTNKAPSAVMAKLSTTKASKTYKDIIETAMHLTNRSALANAQSPPRIGMSNCSLFLFNSSKGIKQSMPTLS